MANGQEQNLEMQDKPDGCLSATVVDEEREPCLKESETNKNNGVASKAAAADNNNSTSNGGGKFLTFTATSLEQKLRDKTGFSRVGLTVAAVELILCLFLFIALVVLLILWPRPPHVFPLCRRAACLRASAEVLPKINFTYSVCRDYREFSCGGWLHSNDLPPYMSSWSLKKRIQQDQKIKTRNMIVTLRNVATTTSFNWKMKYFYESCMNLDNIETDDSKPLKKIISTILGGWHVLKDFNVHAWDPSQTIVKLHAEYSVSPFFKIDVVPDDRVAGQNIIQISPAGLGLPNRRYYYRQQDAKIVAAYKHYLVDVSQLLGATSGDASIFSNDMFHYEKRIAEITPADKLEDPFTSHNRMKLSQFKEIAGLIPLLDILHSKFPDSGITDDTYISVVSPTYFSNVSNLISSSDRSGLNDYYMWKMAEAYVPYLSNKFRDIVKIYTAELTGEKDSPPRWETCVSVLQKFMGFGIAATLESSTENKAEVVGVVKELFDNVKDTIRSGIEKSKGLEPELRAHVLDKLNSITIQVGLPEHTLQDSYINQFYNLLPIQRLDFFPNVNHAISFLKDYSQTKLKSKKEEYRWLDDLVSDDPKVTYNVASNKVIVPLSLLSPPYFEIDYSEALIYGGLGVEISSAILSSVYPSGVAFTKEGMLLDVNSVTVNRTVAATIETRNCFGDSFKGQQVEVLNNTALTAMLSVSSVRFALQSLQKKTKLEPHFHQPAMENYGYDKLFFLTYAQSLCTIKSPQQQDLDTMYDLMSDESLLLKTVADHLDLFKSVFQCPESSSKTCNYIY
ncbi:endothelin-converting enzyme 2-like [Adelges cooleyi]|uniref:endothelin-converting enzyme 2-like n=1 Tax=Adelges cooleyi TaxID=133065 RepID=UPI0021802C04|nr:endothelin-converting enzyme 2-like [Adelges cooleyi]